MAIYPGCRNIFFQRVCRSVHAVVQQPNPDEMLLFGLKTLSNNQPLVKGETLLVIAQGWMEVCVYFTRDLVADVFPCAYKTCSQICTNCKIK